PVVMGMYVDEAGGDDLARDVDLSRPRHLADEPDRRNTVAGNRDIGMAARAAAAVDQLTAAQNPVDHSKAFQWGGIGIHTGGLPANFIRFRTVSSATSNGFR